MFSIIKTQPKTTTGEFDEDIERALGGVRG